MRRWLSPNWHLKLLALALAFFVWSTYTGDSPVEIGYFVPLEFSSLRSDLEIAGQPPVQAYVRLRGPARLLRRLTPADLTIEVNLAGLPAGEAFLRLSEFQIHVPGGAKVVRITPSEIRLLLDPRHP